MVKEKKEKEKLSVYALSGFLISLRGQVMRGA